MPDMTEDQSRELVAALEEVSEQMLAEDGYKQERQTDEG